ncbi:MAG: hypothetical protein IPI60_01960 [Saprospiraceae bacterium]|nr:hypothetical protein [Saprospiraceae bacterium]
MRIATLLISMIVLLGACEKEPMVVEKAGLKLTFKAVYDSEPLLLSRNYEFMNGDSIRFQRADLIISDISIGNSKNVSLSQVEWLGFSEKNADPSKIEEGFSFNFNDVEPGVYTSLYWNIGLNQVQNRSTPANYTFPHPLSNAELYWAGWNSYIFSRTDGKLLTESGTYDFSYHTGGDILTRALEWNQNIELKAGEVKEIIIYIDYKKIFVQDGEVYDIKNNLSSHTSAQIAVAHAIADNMKLAVKYELK